MFVSGDDTPTESVDYLLLYGPYGNVIKGTLCEKDLICVLEFGATIKIAIHKIHKIHSTVMNTDSCTFDMIIYL